LPVVAAHGAGGADLLVNKLKIMYTCLLVDDEPIALDILESYLERLGGFNIAGKYTNPLQAFERLRQQPVDLLFLDIQMPELTGLELMQALRRRPEVILTTAYREFALEGFDYDVVDYLLKPIAFDRFLKAIAKFQARNGQSATPATSARPAENTDEAPHIFVRADRKNIRILLDDILYLESLKDYVRIATPQGKITTKDSITHFEEILPPAQFLRVHRSFMVAKNKITAHSADGLEIGKIQIPVGRMYKMEVEKAILKKT
jgi:DNA-binding LytR/AlgR family response regulator